MVHRNQKSKIVVADYCISEKPDGLLCLLYGSRITIIIYPEMKCIFASMYNRCFMHLHSVFRTSSSLLCNHKAFQNMSLVQT